MKIPPSLPQTAKVPQHWKRWQYIEYLIKKHDLSYGAELGIKEGRTMFHLLKTCPRLKMIGVDCWQKQPNAKLETYTHWDFDKMRKHVYQERLKYGYRAKILETYTVLAADYVADNSLDFIFIDANHSAAEVTFDFKKWQPKVRKGGWIIGHDINWPSVKKVADKMLPGYEVGPDNTYARKV